MSSTDPQLHRTTLSPVVNMPSLRQIKTVAMEAARASGRVLMAGFGQPQTVEDRSEHDLKLAADNRGEAAALAILQARFPDHEIVSEEKSVLNRGARFRWYLDPLDGTVNYFLGQPYFCTCLACYHTPPETGLKRPDPLGQPVAGVVYAPALNKCFEAVSGGPALCNGRPIRTGLETRLSDAVIGFSFGSHSDTMQRMITVAALLVKRARKVRIFGATGLDLAHVASGRLSGLVQERVRVWDFAAARIILEAAGGYFRLEENSGESWRITAAVPGIAAELQDIMDLPPL